jgi:hypothetical protein
MSKTSAKARLECLRGWRRAMKIVTKEEKAYQASQKRKAKKEKNFS